MPSCLTTKSTGIFAHKRKAVQAQADSFLISELLRTLLIIPFDNFDCNTASYNHAISNILQAVLLYDEWRHCII